MHMSRQRKAPINLVITLSVSAVILSACASPGASRYGDGGPAQGQVACGPVTVPCQPVAIYPPAQPYVRPMPCLPGQCLPPAQPTVSAPTPPVTAARPVTTARPAYPEPTPYDTPFTLPEPSLPESPLSEPAQAEPPVMFEPPMRLPRAVVDDPVTTTCPEGEIPSYGGQGCIPLTIPRK
jgi:hypothetical protein